MVERKTGDIEKAIRSNIRKAPVLSGQRNQGVALRIMLWGLIANGFIDHPPEEEVSPKIEKLDPIYSHTFFSFDRSNNTVVTANGREAKLTRMQRHLLEIFIRRKNELLDVDILEEEMGLEGPRRVGLNDVLLKTHIKNLRKKIEPDPENPKVLTNTRGFGYIFHDNPDDSSDPQK